MMTDIDIIAEKLRYAFNNCPSAGELYHGSWEETPHLPQERWRAVARAALELSDG